LVFDEGEALLAAATAVAAKDVDGGGGEPLL
jgi:hypothetical protein